MLKLIVFAATFMVLAAPAHAGFVPAAVAWVSATFAVTAATATAALNFAASMAFSAISKAYQKRQLGRAGGVDATQNIEMGDDLPLSFTVGEYATPGKRKYSASWGTNTRFITEVIEISCLPQGLAGFWVDDERGEFLPERGWVSGSGPSSGVQRISVSATVPGGALEVGRALNNYFDQEFTDQPVLWVKVVDGTQTAADPFLVWAFGNDPDYPWTAQHIGRGKTYVIVTSKYEKDTQTRYPTFLWEPAPLPLYDWREDSTAGGSGPQRWGNRATYRPTLNPVVVAYNIARGIYFGDEWVFGGKNLAAWRLPIDEMTAAANACDQPIGLFGGGTEPRYRCGMEIKVDMEPASVLEELGTAANMTFAEVGGRLKVMVDLPGSAVFHFTDTDILTTEGQSFNPFYPAAETYNAISATYPERREKWSLKDAPEYVDEEARASDRGQQMTAEAKYGAVPFARQVQRLMRSLMRSYRRMRRHQFHLPPDAYALEPGIDLVSWTSARNGYINKQFILERVSKTPGMNVLVRLRERTPSDYDWSSDYERPVAIAAPINPRPFVQPINGLTVTAVGLPDASGTARRPAIQVACNGDEAGVTHIQIQARLSGTLETTIDTERPFTDPYRWYLRDVLRLTVYEVRARLMSQITPRSRWSDWYVVTTDDIRFGVEDIDIEEIKTEIREDLDEYLGWIDGADEILEELGEAVDEARDDLVIAQGELQNNIDTARRIALEQYEAALAYTDTSVFQEALARVQLGQSISSQISVLTAALTSDNYLGNPLFADGVTGWNPNPGITGVSRDPASADPIFSGAPSPFFVQVINPSTGTRRMYQTFAIDWNENEVVQWRIRAAASVTDRALQIRLTWFNEADVQIGGVVDTNLALLAGEWRTFSGQHVPREGAVSVRFEMRFGITSVGAITYVADAAFTKVDQSAIARITDLEVVVASVDEAFTLHSTQANSRLQTNEAAISTESSTRADAISALSGVVTQVSAVASQARTYRQGTAPANPRIGDIWFNSSAGNFPTRWSGTAWVATDDTRIAQNAASISAETLARANAVSSLASQINSIDVAYGEGLKSGNLVVNGSVGTGNFSGWSHVSPELAVVARDPNHAGNAVRTSPTPFMIEAPADGATRWARAISGVTCEQGERFLIKARAAGGGVNINFTWRLQLRFLDIAGQLVRTFNRDIQIQSNNWRPTEFDFITVPDGAVLLEFLRVERMSGGIGSGYLTDVRLERESGFDSLTSAQIRTEQLARADAISGLAQTVSTVSATASRARTFRNANPPADPQVGDIWYDTSSNSIPKRWMGTSWADVADTRTAQNAADIVTEQRARATAVGAVADLVTTVSARTDRGTAQGRIRMTASSGPAGVQQRIGIIAEASGTDSSHSAGMFWDARSDGTTQIVAVANRFAIATSGADGAARLIPFVVDGGTVYIDKARIKDADIDTLKIAGNSVTMQWGASAYNLNINLAFPADLLIFTQIRLRRQSAEVGGNQVEMTLRRGTTILDTTLMWAQVFDDDKPNITTLSMSAGQHTITHEYQNLGATGVSITRPRIAVFARYR